MVIETPSFGFSFCRRRYSVVFFCHQRFFQLLVLSHSLLRKGRQNIHILKLFAVTGLKDQKAIWSVYLKAKTNIKFMGDIILSNAFEINVCWINERERVNFELWEWKRIFQLEIFILTGKHFFTLSKHKLRHQIFPLKLMQQAIYLAAK